MGFHPKPRQGNVVKVSSLREDGCAAALSWRYSYPCTPICRTMNMVLRYRVEGVTPSWEFEVRTAEQMRRLPEGQGCKPCLSRTPSRF